MTPQISVFSTLPPLLSMTPAILVDHRLDLLGRHVLAGHENVLVERHGGPFSFVAFKLMGALRTAFWAGFKRPIGAKPFEP